MTTRILSAAVLATALLVASVQESEARGIRTDTGGNTSSSNNGWTDLAGAALPPNTTLPAGLLINPFSTSNPIAITSLAALMPTVVKAGWGTNFAPAVLLLPGNSLATDGYEDAQTFPLFLTPPCSSSDPNCYDPTSYYVNNNVLGLDLEWWSTGTSPAAFAQVIFFSLGSPSPAANPIFPNKTIYDSFGKAQGSASGAWEIEFNCGNSGCTNGASLLWDGILYTASANVLTTSSVAAGGVTVTTPAGETLFNEFVFNNGVLYPPPGWAATTIAVPSGLSTSSGNGSITLTWTPTAGASTYNVYQSSATGGEGNTPVKIGITAGSAQIGGLTSGSKYFFKVTAVYSGVESSQSSEVGATVLPAAPTSLTATAGATSISLNWTAGSGATSYNIYQGSIAGGESGTPITTVTGTSYTVSSLNPGQPYFFTVVAVDAGGNSPASNEVTTAVLTTAPTGLSATAGNGAVTLSWSASTGATSYNIYQGTSAGGEASGAAASAMSTSMTISGLTNGQTYYFKVAAVDAGGVSVQSNEASAMPAAPPPPPASGGGGGGSIDLVDLLAANGLLLFGLWQKRSRAP